MSLLEVNEGQTYEDHHLEITLLDPNDQNAIENIVRSMYESRYLFGLITPEMHDILCMQLAKKTSPAA